MPIYNSKVLMSPAVSPLSAGNSDITAGFGAAPAMIPASTGVRFIADLLDVLALAAGQLLLSLALSSLLPRDSAAWQLGAQIVVLIASIAAFWLNFIWGPTRHGASLGKAVTGLSVRRYADGSFPSTKEMMLRVFVAKPLSSLSVIGMVMILFRLDKRGLHDLIAGTQVVNSHSL